MKTHISPKARKSLERMIDRFETGDLAPIRTAVCFAVPKTWPASRWSMLNRITAFGQADDLHCRGFMAWQHLNRKVKRGGRAVYIWGPRHYTQEEPDPETGEPVKKQVLCGFRPVAVFPYSQTEGDPLPPEQQPSFTPVDLPALAPVAAALGITVEYTPTSDDRYGDYSPEEDHIRLGTINARTFYHELAHAIHYRIETDAGAQDNTRKEVIAEFTAAVLMDLYEGTNTSGKSFQYIKEHAQEKKKDPIEAVMAALGTIEKVLQYIEEAAVSPDDRPKGE